MIGLGLSIPQVAVRGSSGSAPFTPLSLYASGEEGAWYDPSDLSTMFTTSTGTTAAAVDGPVGLLLDKRKGLVRGAEQITNGDFNTNIDGWTNETASSATWNEGAIRITRGAATAVVSQEYSTSGGRWIEITGRARVVSGGGSAGIRAVTRGGSVYASSPLVTGSEFQDVQAIGFEQEGSSGYDVDLIIGAPEGTIAEFDNVSVRPLPGNHATQATAAARPTLRQTAGGLYYLEFDGVDDFIDATGMAASAGPITLASASLSDDGETVRLQYTIDIQTGRVIFGTVSDTAGSTGVFDGTTWQEANVNTEAAMVNVAMLETTDAVFRSNGSTLITFNMTERAIGGNVAVGKNSGASSNFLDGRLHGLIVRAASSDAAQIDSIESYLAGKSGVTL